MSSIDTLPIVLVSTASEADATSVLSELINDDVTAEYNKETQCTDRVWRLVNKYYSADVRVHALVDDQALSLDPNCIEAHIVHITEDELAEGCATAERRAGAALTAWRRADVRVLLADCARDAPLRAWAAAQRAEFAPRRSPPRAAPPGPFAPCAGVERARAALHAHVWPNLRRADRTSAERAPSDGTDAILTRERSDQSKDPEAASDTESGASSDSEPWGESESAAELRAVERAEQFAAALGALGSRPRAADLPAMPRDARLDHAEELVAAFCRALGLDPDV